MPTSPRRSVLVLALLCAACADDPAPADAPRPAAGARAADAPAPAAAAALAPMAPDTGYTAWTTLRMPSEPWSQSAADPRALLTRVRDVAAAQMEEPDAGVLPTRLQSASADSAVGLLTHPDLADDSIRDVEFRIHMRPQGSQWTVSAIERRERCRRGVAEGGRCA